MRVAVPKCRSALHRLSQTRSRSGQQRQCRQQAEHWNSGIDCHIVLEVRILWCLWMRSGYGMKRTQCSGTAFYAISDPAGAVNEVQKGCQGLTHRRARFYIARSAVECTVQMPCVFPAVCLYLLNGRCCGCGPRRACTAEQNEGDSRRIHCVEHHPDSPRRRLTISGWREQFCPAQCPVR